MSTPILDINTALGLVIHGGYGGYEPISQLQGVKLAPALDWIEGLEMLQKSSTTFVESSSIDSAVQFQHSFLPEHVRSQINVVTGNYGALFDAFNQGKEGDRNFQENLETMHDEYGFFAALKSARWTLWPINTNGNHWMCVVLELAQTVATGLYDRVVAYAIVDGFRNTKNRDFFLQRVVRVLERDGITVPRNAQRQIWSPRQPDGYTCGLRTTHFMWEMMNRMSGVVLGEKADQELWMPMSGYFDPDHVRLQMAGYIAAWGLRDLKYKARVSIQLVRSTFEFAPAAQRPAAEKIPPSARTTTSSKT
ncbi:hypothetical protein F4778DRAFT_783287 [Xylariomycetidae sp. FL2044]|nr:hypothetical protein F4778DRAFT_783287 [Xylariomycetidae sp. FL2044]